MAKKFYQMNKTEFNEWFDSLEEPYRMKFFLWFFGGWIPLLLASDLIRPYNEVVATVLGVVAGCWMFVVGIIGLERAFTKFPEDK